MIFSETYLTQLEDEALTLKKCDQAKCINSSLNLQNLNL